MLIRFRFNNFLSFKDDTELSMVAGRAQQHQNHKVSFSSAFKLDILRATAIYGKNASGKSNFVQAISFAKFMVTNTHRLRSSIPVRPFRLNTEFLDKPSSFQFELMINGKVYDYGFKVSRDEIIEEWLVEIKRTTETMIFKRKGKIVSLGQIDYSKAFDDNLKPSTELIREKELRLTFVGEDTRPNQLFLTATIERDQPYFENIFNWFENSLYIIRPDSKYLDREFRIIEGTEDFLNDFQELLKQLDTGIEGIQKEEVDLESEFIKSYPYIDDLKQVVSDIKPGSKVLFPMPDERRFALIKDDHGRITCYKLMTKHKLSGGSKLFDNVNQFDLFEINWESQGTQRLMDLIPYFFLMRDSSTTFIIDELARSLHPEVSYKLVDTILNNDALKKSQIIFTTHEDYLMDLDLLRRDEIWFAEKNEHGESSIYSLEEFKPRYDKDIRRGYMKGRFGGIPIIDKRGLRNVLSHSLEN